MTRAWSRPGGRTSRLPADLLDRVGTAAQAEQWFPDLRTPLRVEVVLVQERRRCVLHRLRLSDGRDARDVLLKERRAGGLNTTSGTARPSSAPVLGLTEREHARLEFAGLQRAAAALAPDPAPAAQLRVVRPLLLLEEHAALVMDHVPWPTLDDRLAAAHRAGRSRDVRSLPGVGTAAGQWLRRLHATDPVPAERCRLHTGADVARLVGDLGAHLARVKGDRALFARVRAASRVLETALPKDLPITTLHGDFAPRNVLVSPSGGVAVIDAMPTWQAPVHEDVARMIAGLRLMRLQLFSGGLGAAAAALDGFESAFRRAYYGDDGPRLELAAFLLLVVLDRWAAQVLFVNRVAHRAPRAAASWLDRAVVLEVRRQLDLVEQATAARPARRSCR